MQDMGFEPMCITALAPQASPLTTWVILQMRPSGIEPEFTVWKTAILPLNYRRKDGFFERENPNSTGLTRIRTEVGGVRIPSDSRLHYKTG